MALLEESFARDERDPWIGVTVVASVVCNRQQDEACRSIAGPTSQMRPDNFALTEKASVSKLREDL